MKKHRLASVFLIAIMATGILAFTPTLTSAQDWTPGLGPPIVVDGSLHDWDPIKPIYDESGVVDTEPWSWNGTTGNASLAVCGLQEGVITPPIATCDAARDLQRLYMWFEPTDTISIRIDVLGLFPGFGFAPGQPGMSNVSAYIMYMSTNLTAGSGSYPGQLDGLFFINQMTWEYALVVSEAYVWLINYTTDMVDCDPVSGAHMPLFFPWASPMIGNITYTINYTAGAIEIQLPRSDLEHFGALQVVNVVLASYKPGLWPGVTSPAGLPGANQTGGWVEYLFPHVFDPQSAILGDLPWLSGEECPFQAKSAGADCADIMTPAWVAGSPGGLYAEWRLVNQPPGPPIYGGVDMSPGAKIEIVDQTNQRENITDLYSKGEVITLEIKIVDAMNMTGYQIGLEWNPALLTCKWENMNGLGPPDYYPGFEWKFGVPVLGPSSHWSAVVGSIDNVTGKFATPYGLGLLSGKSPKSGSATFAYAYFEVIDDFGKSWVCPIDTKFVFRHAWWSANYAVDMIVVFATKNALVKISPPPPGPPTLSYEQDPEAPPHYVGDPITFDLSGSTGGFNGTHVIPIVNYSITVWNSSGLIYSEENANPVKVFTPLSEDCYTFVLDIRLDATVDPLYPSQWLYVESDPIEKCVTVPAESGIECFTEAMRRCGALTPFRGKGWNASADAYSLDDEVTVYSWVFYNGWPKQNFLVGYEVYDPNGTLVLVRNRMTNATGFANMSFRILTMCGKPEYAFGKWRIFQKVYMCEIPYNDTLWFDVGWLVELETVEPVEPIYEYGEHMEFVITGKVISQMDRYIVVSLVIYDHNGVPIAIRTFGLTVDGGEYCNPAPLVIPVSCLEIPKWFYPGVSTIYVNAWFNALPTGCGHACCPEISGTVLLEAPPLEFDP